LDTAETFEETVKKIIEEDLSFDLSWHSASFGSCLDEWKSSHPQKPYPPQVMWELTALDAMADTRHDRKPNEPYFKPVLELVNRDTNPPTLEIYPDVKGTLSDDNAVIYYQARCNETKNPIRKARYADLLWEALHVKRDRRAYSYAIQAGNAYLDQVSLYFEQERGLIHLTNNFQRVAEISVVLNTRDLALKVVQTISDLLSSLLENEEYHYISEFFKTLEFIAKKFPDSVSSQYWQQVREICYNAIVKLEVQKPLNDLLVQAMVQGMIISSVRLGDDAIAWEYRVRVAEINENEAKARESGEGVTNGSLVSLKFIQDALHDYQDLVSIAPNEKEKSRMSRKVEEMKREIRRLIRQSENEMKTISVSVEVPKEKVEQFIKPLLEANSIDVLPMLSSYPDLTPNIDELREQAKHMGEEAPLTSILGKTQIRDGRIIDQTPPFSNEDALSTQLGFWFQSHAQLLDIIFYRLKGTRQITRDSLLTHLQTWEFVDERDLPFLEKGINHYFADDHVSALHLLVPRIEHMLKSTFEQTGVPSVAVPNERQIREQTFGDFLRREDVRNTLGESIWYYLYFALVDESGLNLRNDIAHGWIELESCNRVTVQISLYCILQLTRLQKKNPDDK
jgi:hypothetical protein